MEDYIFYSKTKEGKIISEFRRKCIYPKNHRLFRKLRYVLKSKKNEIYCIGFYKV